MHNAQVHSLPSLQPGALASGHTTEAYHSCAHGEHRLATSRGHVCHPLTAGLHQHERWVVVVVVVDVDMASGR